VSRCRPCSRTSRGRSTKVSSRSRRTGGASGVVDFVARDRRCHARRLAVGEANRSALPFAVEVAVSPMPVVAMVLMLDHAAGARERDHVRGRLGARGRGGRVR
jgi:hypothetical protein